MENIIITGGTSGIGLSLVKSLSKTNCKIFILGRSKKKWNNLKLSQNLKKKVQFIEPILTVSTISSTFTVLSLLISPIRLLWSN